MREKAVWLTEGVTLSGALRGGTVCGHTLESAILAAEGVRIEIQISQAKGQSRKRKIFSVTWRYMPASGVQFYLESRLFYFPKKEDIF